MSGPCILLLDQFPFCCYDNTPWPKATSGREGLFWPWSQRDKIDNSRRGTTGGSRQIHFHPHQVVENTGSRGGLQEVGVGTGSVWHRKWGRHRKWSETQALKASNQRYSFFCKAPLPKVFMTDPNHATNWRSSIQIHELIQSTSLIQTSTVPISLLLNINPKLKIKMTGNDYNCESRLPCFQAIQP